MKTLPEGSRVVRCMRCRDPINQPIGVDGQSVTHGAQCSPAHASRENRLDRIRAAALAAQAARIRAPLPLPNRFRPMARLSSGNRGRGAARSASRHPARERT
jgi:hypothetical protein